MTFEFLILSDAKKTLFAHIQSKFGVVLSFQSFDIVQSQDKIFLIY